ncbi:MAG: MBL fold metallo-hydrolase [Candidatus Hodarchaeales archaeon]|jgi:predicted metal-dependent RNase
MLKLIPFGATDEVGRSCFLLTDGETRILIDCGVKIMPKSKGERTLGPYGVDKIAPELDAVLLSHAHLDHSGYIPALYRAGFDGPVYMTSPTADIVKFLWKDHLKIEGPYHYSLIHLLKALDNTQATSYRVKRPLVNGVSFKFLDAGHILGSASIYLEWNGTSILYTGDINNQKTPFFEPAEVPDINKEPVDVLITESTNGGREVPLRKAVLSEFTKAILKTYSRDGKILIPAFALGRSQEIEYYLLDKLDGLVGSKMPLWVDGMIQDMNNIYEKYFKPHWVSKRAIDFCKDNGHAKPFDFPELKSIRTAPKKKRIKEFRRDLITNDEKTIILTTSGMMEGGPIHSYLRYGGLDSKSLLAVVGYQVPDTIGYEILNGKREFQVQTPWKEKFNMNIRLNVQRFHFSGHITQKGLESYLNLVKPEKVIAIHGSPEAIEVYRNRAATYGYGATSIEEEEEHVLSN